MGTGGGFIHLHPKVFCHSPRITIEEFNADQFQTNLAILLGIPPERIVVTWLVGG